MSFFLASSLALFCRGRVQRFFCPLGSLSLSGVHGLLPSDHHPIHTAPPEDASKHACATYDTALFRAKYLVPLRAACGGRWWWWRFIRLSGRRLTALNRSSCTRFRGFAERGFRALMAAEANSNVADLGGMARRLRDMAGIYVKSRAGSRCRYIARRARMCARLVGEDWGTKEEARATTRQQPPN